MMTLAPPLPANLQSQDGTEASGAEVEPTPTDAVFPAFPVVHRWSVEEYEGMVERGALGEDLRVELLDGLIVDKMPNNPPHAFPVGHLTQFFAERGSGRWVVRCQLPVRLPQQRSVPEPDVLLLHPPATAYRRRHPEPADVLLPVEVADSSLRIDRHAKLAIYARAGITEYWVLDVPETLVETYRDPDPDAGRYRTTLVARAGETCAPAAFADAVLSVDDFLG